MKRLIYISERYVESVFLCYNSYMSKKIEKNEKGVIKISVRDLVEFILREGDIDNRHGRGASAEAMLAGEGSTERSRSGWAAITMRRFH